MSKTLSFVLLCIFFIFTLFMSGCSQESPRIKHPAARNHKSVVKHSATMRSYRVMGKRYHPTYVEVGQMMRGVSSWYGPNFHGKQTSNGEVYNMHARTAAHKTWPMNTMVRVYNLENGKSTIVRINDRGPFVKGRIIDCSYAAGKELGLDKMGIAKVSIEVLGFAGKIEPSERIAKEKKTHTQTRVVLSNFGIQVGAFRHYAGAQTIKANYSKRYRRYNPIIKRFDVGGKPLYRVWLMGFGSQQEARDFKNNNNMAGAFIVRN